MKHKILLSSFISTLLLSTCVQATAQSNTLAQETLVEAEKPNVIVVIVDDAGYNDFGFMGSQEMKTPHIDQLASQGVVFTDAHTSGTVCAPSRAGLLAGRYQHRFGFTSNLPAHHMDKPKIGMDVDEYTLANLYQDNGYNTFAVGKWHIGEYETLRPNARGFDEFFGLLSGSRSYYPTYDPAEGLNNKIIVDNDTPVEFEGYLTDVLGDKAVDYIEESKDKPFFMYFSPTAVHAPMEARADILAKYKQQNHPRPVLAAMTESLDINVGKITKKLSDDGLLENTVIIFLSDNGGDTSNNTNNFPLKGYKGEKFEGGHRVPFFVSWPKGLQGGDIYDGLTSALDIYATSEAILGLEHQTSKSHDGVNLLPFLQANTPNEQQLSASTSNPHDKLFWSKDVNSSMRQGDLKLIVVNNRFALFNLADDLSESNDIARQHPETVKQMMTELEKWHQELPKPRWDEGKVWAQITVEKHLAGLDNRKVRYKNPQQLKRFLAKQKK